VSSVGTIVTETMQLVLSQFQHFYCSQLTIEKRFSLPKKYLKNKLISLESSSKKKTTQPIERK